MWERIDTLLEESGSSLDDLRTHRVELLEARRRRAAGLPLDDELGAEVTRAAIDEMAALPLLTRVRAAYDGPLVLIKGPEVALDYGAPGLRRFGDLDLLTDDADAAQAALLEAGFVEVFEPELYEDIHHLRPLWWPGLPLTVELHSRVKWPAGVPGPATEELLEAAVPGRLGVDGVATLPPEHHALVLAAHAWAHQPLGRLGDLLDVAVTLRRSDRVRVAELAARWGCSRLWRSTDAAVRSVVDGAGRSAGVALWARHLRHVRERTVFEAHLHDVLAPLWSQGPVSALRALVAEIRATANPVRREPWRRKLTRARLAVRNARVAQSQHDLVLEAQGADAVNTEEAG